jgi:hypothetical protein
MQVFMPHVRQVVEAPSLASGLVLGRHPVRQRLTTARTPSHLLQYVTR